MKSGLEEVLPGDPPAKRVVVVGAGIAGMTAAHELAERGYEVEVIEAVQDPQALYGQPTALVGGLARTSWSRVPQPGDQVPLKISVNELPSSSELNKDSRRKLRRLEPIKTDKLLLPVVVPLTLTAEQAFAPGSAATNLLDEYRKSKKAGRRLSLIVVVMEPKLRASSVGDALGSTPPATALRKWIREGLAGDVFSLSVLAAQSAAQQCVQFSLEDDRVPGEHGYRFFPSFYSHMFDTMQRIPIPEASTDTPLIPGTVLQADSSRSVFDNLKPGSTLEMAFQPQRGERRAFQMTRGPAQSLEVVRRLIANLLEKAGYRGADLARVSTRYLEYLTSCPERRQEEYESQTWAKFLELETTGDRPYSSYFASSMQLSAQALVAMSARKSDARTVGSVSMQLVLDQLRTTPCVDGILNGPTTTALFAPWQTYLESLGVTFTQASLVGFEGKGMAVRPVFGRLEDSTKEKQWQPAAVDPADFYVMTLPVHDFQGLFDDKTPPPFSYDDRVDKEGLLKANAGCLSLDKPSTRIALGESLDDISKYLKFQGVAEVSKEPDAGPFRYMCGIQFFFGANVKLVEGHSICVDSPWGVSFLSQMQYWQDRQRGGDGIQAVISAVFTRFQAEAAGRDGKAKEAIDCSPDELAERVWLQIQSTWDVGRLGRLPEPDYYYLDVNLVFDDKDGKKNWTNQQPYLVNDLGTWPKRGGARTTDGDYEYGIQLGHTVFAGAFMRTTTRLNTMEAANESARRAVNAILDADGSDVPRCQLWNMEDDEAPDLMQLRDLDRRIFLRGGRHFLRSPSVDAMLRVVPWDLARLLLPTYSNAQEKTR
jgi:uncharacterized protein with NAD-binding domain and iron-sulfur cluster